MQVSFPEQVAQALLKHQMLRTGSRVLVAFSGGADSLSLLYALYTIRESWDLTIAAAHLDHGLRGETSRADADWAEGFCRSKGIPFFRGYWNGTREVKPGNSPEAAAREARRRFLENTLAQWGGDAIALGHHLDDQAETVLIHLLHGAGLRGLGGMRPVNGLYIRPLLEISRSCILEYIAEIGLTPRDDETNEDIAYLRNRIRRQVVPLLKACSPGFAVAAGRMAELARREDDFLDRLAGEALAGLTAPPENAPPENVSLENTPLENTPPENALPENTPSVNTTPAGRRMLQTVNVLPALYKLAGMTPDGEEGRRISLAGLLSLDPVLAMRAIRLWALPGEDTSAVIDMQGTQRIFELARSGRIGARTDAGGGVMVRKDKDCLVVLPHTNVRKEEGIFAATVSADTPHNEQLVMPGTAVEWLPGKTWITARWLTEDSTEDLPEERIPSEASSQGNAPGTIKNAKPFDRYVCSMPEQGPWPVVRRRSAGDWLWMPYGRKKLKDLFIEKHIPIALRDAIPLLAWESQILWAPGVVKGQTRNELAPPDTKEKQMEFTCLLS